MGAAVDICAVSDQSGSLVSSECSRVGEDTEPIDATGVYARRLMRVLMVSRSHYEWDVRVRREARALSDAGHSVAFLGLASTMSHDCDIQLIQLGQPPRSREKPSNRGSGPSYRTARWLLLPEYRQMAERHFQKAVIEAAENLAFVPDAIHAHDFPALAPSAELADRFGSRLVYDSHEIWAERPRRGRPEPIRRRLKRRLEAELAARADAVIMVSDHGAEYLRNSLGLDHVHVVRNTFPMVTGATPPKEPSGAVYAGRIAPLRDLHTVFAARIWHEPPMKLHIMGEIDDVEVPVWVELHSLGTMDEVNELLMQVGIGLVTMTDRYVNHRVALPNKLFQSIAAGIPVVATDVPQTAEVVREFDVGELYKPGDAEAMDRAVRRVVGRYGELLANVADARSEFDWSVDADRLVTLYRDLERPVADLSKPGDSQ